MFSKELENLILATLEDGVLEENEKAALVKRAEREGVDLAELEIYINSILQKRARELDNEKTAVRKQVENEKKEAFGRKCPNCGTQVPPLTLKCECGYEFTKKDSISSVQLLSDKIDAILSEPYKKSGEYKKEVSQRYQRIKEIINLYSVPNTKEDIIEFLSLSAPNAKKKGGIWGTKSGRLLIVGLSILFLAIAMGFTSSVFIDMFIIVLVPGLIIFSIFAFNMSSLNPTFIHNDLANAWRAKFDQVLMKGRSLRGDAEFQNQLDYYENMFKK